MKTKKTAGTQGKEKKVGIHENFGRKRGGGKRGRAPGSSRILWDLPGGTRGEELDVVSSHQSRKKKRRGGYSSSERQANNKDGPKLSSKRCHLQKGGSGRRSHPSAPDEDQEKEVRVGTQTPMLRGDPEGARYAEDARERVAIQSHCPGPSEKDGGGGKAPISLPTAEKAGEDDS